MNKFKRLLSEKSFVSWIAPRSSAMIAERSATIGHFVLAMALVAISVSGIVSNASAQGCSAGSADSFACNTRTCCDCGCSSSNTSCAFCAELGSLRKSMASSGITFQSNVTQFYFGNTTGGVQREFDYGGHGDYLMNMDLGKLGVHEGLTLKVRAEHRFGESIADEVGTLLAPDLAARLPLPGEDELYITNFMLTQALSDNFVVFAGKFDTLDGDYNAFASGRGIRQFSNTAFIANPIAFRTVPYSTVGVGFSYLFEGQPLFSFSVVNPVDVSNTIGLSELYAEGVTMSGELIIPTKVGGLPGQQLFAATYSNRVYTSLGQDPRVVLPNVPVATQSGSWSFYWNTHQYLAVDPYDSDRGWGYFARASIGDKDTNPLEYFLSAGIGGSSAIRARANDTFGIGYYYAGTSSEVGPVLETVLGPIGDGQGFEAFYNIAVSPMVTITPDVQVIEAARENLDTALVAGVRMNLAF